MILAQVNATVVSIEAIDQVLERQQLTPEKVFSVKSTKFNDSGNLTYIFQMKTGAKVILTANIYVSDRLINGTTGAVKCIQIQRGLSWI